MSGKDLIEAGVDAWNAHDRAATIAAYAENCVFTTPDGTGKGHDAVGAFFDMNLAAFPDNQVRIIALVDGGDMVVEEGVFSGANTGQLNMPDGSELPATGKSVELPYVMVYTIRGDKIAEARAYWDGMSFAVQLGLVPSP